MEINEYQEKAVSTAIYGEEHKIVYPMLGLCGETGEVAEKIKKVLRDNNGNFTIDKKVEIAKELGDVMWYVSALARDLGYPLNEITDINLDKLASRRDRGKIQGNGDNR
jgi:NTP pyrophosphatase (non-canonical NTP hydrolase)